MSRGTRKPRFKPWGWVVASEQASESKKPDATQELDDFDAAGDFCDFGFSLVQPPLMKPAADNRSDTSRQFPTP